MNVLPYASVGDAVFGMRRAQVVDLVGPPVRTGLSGSGRVELHYADACYRFDADALAEITVNAPTLRLDGAAVAFGRLPAHLQAHDPAAFQTVGFRVSPRYGIAFDPRHRAWVTAFPREGLVAWRDA